MAKPFTSLTPAQTDVVILCGGLGTRLRGVLGNHPKGMALVQGRPFLEILIDWAAAFGFRRFVFCIGYQGAQIRAHFSDRKDLQVVFSEETLPLGTGGALRFSRNHLRRGAFVVLNGDSICRIDLGDMLKFHHGKGAQVTIAAAEPGSRKDGGYMRLDRQGHVTSFLEKTYETGLTINAGIYIMDHTILGVIPDGKPVSLEKDIFPSLLNDSVYAYSTSQKVQDIGTPERLKAFREA